MQDAGLGTRKQVNLSTRSTPWSTNHTWPGLIEPAKKAAVAGQTADIGGQKGGVGEDGGWWQAGGWGDDFWRWQAFSRYHASGGGGQASDADKKAGQAEGSRYQRMNSVATRCDMGSSVWFLQA